MIYNGELERPQDTLFIEVCETRMKRPNVLMILVTDGGDANCAYRIARYLQNNYEDFTVYVAGYCKSAGTLLALGADQIVVSEHGELGPLDVQDAKKDDLIGMQSGLIPQNAINEIQRQAFAAFEVYFLEIMANSDNRIALGTATKVASSLVTGLFSPLLAELDPLYIGEIARATAVARDYGSRLLEHSQNMHVEELDRLITEYNSHGFVIDQMEAKELFKNFRHASSEERELARSLGDCTLYPMTEFIDDDRRFVFLSPEIEHGVDDGSQTFEDDLESE